MCRKPGIPPRDGLWSTIYVFLGNTDPLPPHILGGIMNKIVLFPSSPREKWVQASVTNVFVLILSPANFLFCKLNAGWSPNLSVFCLVRPCWPVRHRPECDLIPWIGNLGQALLVPVPESGNSVGARGIPGRAWIDLGLPPLQANTFLYQAVPAAQLPVWEQELSLWIIPMDNPFLWEKLVQGDSEQVFVRFSQLGQTCPDIWGETAEARKGGF